ncbi:hypothetical protein M758_10G169800 [Ceratodon purpureus]|nr:hypothetical protein M758_10G169800 [Ceratodon purpureus]
MQTALNLTNKHDAQNSFTLPHSSQPHNPNVHCPTLHSHFTQTSKAARKNNNNPRNSAIVPNTMRRIPFGPAPCEDLYNTKGNTRKP